MNYRASIIRRASTYGSSPSFKFGSASDLPYLLNSSPSMNLRRFTAKSLLESIETEIEITHDVFWEKISLLNEEQFQILTILIFRKDPSLRRSLELDFLEKLLQNYGFFKEIRNKISNESYRELFKEFRFESHSKAVVLFNYGEVGKKFYLILSGAVYVLIPKQKKMLLEQTVKLNRPFLYKAGNEEEELLELFPNLQLINVLKEGDLFGEISLSLKEPRTATLVCKEDSTFGVLNAYSYERILKNNYESELKFLKKTAIFQGFSLPNLAIIKGYVTEIAYAKEQIIYKQKDPPDKIYIVREGEVELIRNFEQKEIEENEENQEIELLGVNPKKTNKRIRFSIGKLGIGETFGEEEAFLEKKRLYSVSVSSIKARILVINKENLFQNLKSLKSLNSIQSHSKEKFNWRINQLKELRKMLIIQNEPLKRKEIFHSSGLSNFMEKPSNENKTLFLQTVALKHLKKKGEDNEKRSFLSKKPHLFKEIKLKQPQNGHKSRFFSQESGNELKQFEISPILKMCAVSSALSKLEKRKRKFSMPNVKQMLINFENDMKKSIENSAFKKTKEFKPKDNLDYLEENRLKIGEEEKNLYEKKILRNSLGIEKFYCKGSWGKQERKEKNQGFLSQRTYNNCSEDKEKSSFYCYPLH